MEKLPRIKPPGPLNVWDVIEKVRKDGRPIKFTIQEIPEDRYEEAITHMNTYFIKDEPTCECLKAIDDPEFIENVDEVWRQTLEQGISIGAFVDNPNGGKSIMAGLNMLGVDFKEHDVDIDDFSFASEKLRSVFKTVIGLTKKAGVYDHYGVNKYMFAFGLSIAPVYRGYGLSTDVLRARDKIGREYDIPVTCTAFTSPISAKSAVRAGFELLVEKDYADIVNKDGKEYFPGIKSKSLKIMAKRIS